MIDPDLDLWLFLRMAQLDEDRRFVINWGITLFYLLFIFIAIGIMGWGFPQGVIVSTTAALLVVMLPMVLLLGAWATIQNSWRR